MPPESYASETKSPESGEQLFNEFHKVREDFLRLEMQIADLTAKRQDVGEILRNLSKRIEGYVRETLEREENANGARMREAQGGRY